MKRHKEIKDQDIKAINLLLELTNNSKKLIKNETGVIKVVKNRYRFIKRLNIKENYSFLNILKF